jgi:hypothetical protein
MAKLPERGLTDPVPENVAQMMRELNMQHGNRAHERVLRLAVMGGLRIMPGCESLGGGDVILSDGAHREFTVHQPAQLRFENLADLLAKKATQANTVEVYMQINHADATRTRMREWMQDLANEVRAGRRNALRRIYVRLFDRFGWDLWEGRFY